MLHRLYAWYGKRTVISVSIVVLLLLGVGIFLLVSKDKNSEVAVEPIKSSVVVKKVSDLGFSSAFSTVGTVQAVSEAQLQTEAGGRVTSVSTEIGKQVSAGSILATIENNAERASLLQAEGAYEAAVAGAASSEVSVDGAKTGLESSLTSGITTYQSTHITVDTILHNDIDDLFTITNGKATGIKIDAKGQALVLNEERTQLETVIQNWSATKNTATAKNISSLLSQARENTLRIAIFVDTLTALVADQDVSGSFTQTQKDAYQAMLYNDRILLNTALQQLEGADLQITSAQKAYEQAQIAGSQNAPSAASAQVKIALGALRGAQANYEKTLVRTPISGVVNALYLKTGDYVTPSQVAVIVANNNGLEITTSISETDREAIAIGDPVVIDKTSSGVVTAIGGAIDPSTGKVAIKVSVDSESDLKNGSTVTLDFSLSNTKPQTELSVPLSSLKMTGSGPIAFEVTSDSKLKGLPVVLGAIKGDSVVITSGLNFDSEIVIDARGLKDGQEVIVEQK